MLVVIFGALEARNLMFSSKSFNLHLKSEKDHVVNHSGEDHASAIKVS